MKIIQILLLTFTLFTSDLLANNIATITAITGKSNILRSSKKITATLGLKLQENDTILTGENAKLQIIFTDETIISIGKNSNFSIKEYLFEDGEAPIARFGMLSGAMRTITGKIGKIAPQKFSVTTKTATIGIRGTNFTVAINEFGILNAYCTYGEISVKVDEKEFSVKQGLIITILQNKKTNLKEFNAKELKKLKNKYFATNKKSSTNTLSISDTNSLKSSSSKDTQLDLTITDTTDATVQNVENTTKDISENIQSSDSRDSIIAGYTLSTTTYWGNYDTTTNTSSLADRGDAKMTIDFAHDTATLYLGNFDNGEADLKYRYDNVNTSYVDTGLQVNGTGTSNITFYGPAGKIISGDFTYIETDDKSAIGTYTAETSEDIH